LKIISVKEPNEFWVQQMHLLNQQNTPEVGDVPDIENFKQLIKFSENILIAEKDSKLIGFVLCMKQNQMYKSKNYLYLSSKFSEFLYIDRIAIGKKYRRLGIGKTMYEKIIEAAKLTEVPLLCEVNTKPKNGPSLAFHKYLGFEEIGKNDFDGSSVVYLKKEH
tara:strand:- start:1492 stop:1980 length:489 start_codon:yes stop_codon:yes gene_type:complete